MTAVETSPIAFCAAFEMKLAAIVEICESGERKRKKEKKSEGRYLFSRSDIRIPILGIGNRLLRSKRRPAGGRRGDCRNAEVNRETCERMS